MKVLGLKRLASRHPGYVLTFVLVIGIASASSMAIFNIFNSIFLAPLPFPHPDQLFAAVSKDGDKAAIWSYPMFEAVREASHGVQELGVYRAGIAFFLSGLGEPEQLRGCAVSAGVFRALGAAAQLGRILEDEEAHSQVVLSHGLWARRFGLDADVVGRKVILNSQPYEIIGVMPPGFEFPEKETDLWTSLSPELTWSLDKPYAKLFRPLARLIGGVAPPQTEQSVLSALRAYNSQAAPPSRHREIRLVPLRQELIHGVAPFYFGNEGGATAGSATWLLTGTALFVFLAALSNIAVLALIRGESRRSEIAVRVTLGATPTRVGATLLAENFLLSALGVGLGLGLYAWFRKVLALAVPLGSFSQELEIGDGRLLILATVLALSITGVCSVGPLSRLLGSAPSQLLQPDSFARGKPLGLQETLTVVQILIATMLLVGAGLMGKGLAQLTTFPTRIDAVESFRLQLPNFKYRSPDSALQFAELLLERLRTLPQAQSAAAASLLPFERNPVTSIYTVQGSDVPDLVIEAPSISVSPEYFRTLGLRVISGRGFNSADRAGSSPVAVVDSKTASELWPGRSAVGQRIKEGFPEDQGAWLTVVGVVSSALDRPRRPAKLGQPTSEIYVPLAQAPSGSLRFVIRTREGHDGFAGLAKDVVWSVDPDQPLSAPVGFETLLEEATARQRTYTRLFMILAGIVVLFSGLAAYGLMRYMVVQRERELAIRRALGAGTLEVIRCAMARTAKLCAAGLTIGLLAAMNLGHLLSSLFLEVKPDAAEVYLGALATIALGTLTAAAGPVRRALRTAPSRVLRYE